MVGAWRYRLGSVGVVAGVTALAVVVANAPAAQGLATSLPLLSRLPATTMREAALAPAILTTVAVVSLAFLPLFRPKRRRILDAVTLTHRRLLVAAAGLAAVGYFDYTYRLPRTTLLLVTGTLSVALPAWFVSARPRPSGDGDRAVVVGDDPEGVAAILAATELEVVGYVSPPAQFHDGSPVRPSFATDGGVATPLDAGRRALADLPCLGALSDLESVFADYDVDTALLAFARPDREQFFGTLDACDRFGVNAKVHREHAESVLVAGRGGELVDVDLEPWDWQDRMLKRLFDVVFTTVGLVVLLPVIAVIVVAVKLDSEGPVLYSQERTAEFGGTFTVYKFRSMVRDAERETGAVLSAEDDGGVDPRVTRVGAFLRRTHLDEIPQLWSILVGDMSVVGPRPERPELDTDLQEDVGNWRRRWFVKPGLTGLAQIESMSSSEPDRKLQLDIRYIRARSFNSDIKIILRQIWTVGKIIVSE
ncbi:sugar transferase [Halomarina pelagica]|uniref:sugar transferase n=1 Tax=Halomarina pelagica TaxID=2961599 RepID=UPI0020C59BB1|nr:sugar transferase [Halomarina sp. BND7]